MRSRLIWLGLICAFVVTALAWALVAQRRRLRRLRAILSSTESLARQQRWDQARRRLDTAVSEFPSNAELRFLRYRIEERIREDVARRVRALEETAATGRLDLAQQLLREVEEAGSPGPEVAQLRTKLQDLLRREDLARRIREIEAMVASGDQRGALDMLSSEIRRFPTEPSLRELQATLAERQEHIDLALERARSLLRARHLREAYEVLRQVTEATPDTRVTELLRQVDSAIRDESFRELLFEARRRWETGDVYAAEKMLREIINAAQDTSLQRMSVDLLETLHRELHDREFVTRTEALEEAQRLVPSDPTAVPSNVQMDNVHFTLTGPGVLPYGTASEIQFWIHVDSQRRTVIEYAKESYGPTELGLSVKTEGPFPLPRGARISVRLSIDGLRCSERHKWITWTGEIGKTTFVVEVRRMP